MIQRIFASRVNKLNDTIIELSVVHLASNKTQSAQITVGNPKVLERVMDIWDFPCEELDYGLYGTQFDQQQLIETLEVIVASAASQIPGTPEYEEIQQMGRDIEAEEKCKGKSK